MSKERATPADIALARIAHNQHGVVSLEQLRAAGLASSAITYRIQSGRLHRVHRGVYAVGHGGLTHRGRWKAATMACGAEAVLSHRSAAGLWRLLPHPRPAADVTVPGGGGRRRRKEIRIH